MHLPLHVPLHLRFPGFPGIHGFLPNRTELQIIHYFGRSHFQPFPNISRHWSDTFFHLEGLFLIEIDFYGNHEIAFGLTIRRPFYENEHEFLAPADTSFFLSAVYEPTQILRLRSSWMFLRQGSGYWSGEKDINTGLRMRALILGANIGRHTRLNTSLIVPIRQRMLDGDAFEHGVLLSIGMSQPL